MLRGKRMDPAAWYEERLRKQLTAKVRTLRESGIAGAWFDSWYTPQVAKKVHTSTHYTYLSNLREWRGLWFFRPILRRFIRLVLGCFVWG